MASKKQVAKSTTFNQEQTKAVVAKVGQWTPQSVAQKVTDATVSINKTLADVTSQLQGTLKEYEEANLAVQAKNAELETVFGKEQVLKSIDELHADHANTKTNLQQELTVFTAELASKRQESELEAQQEENQFAFDRDEKRRTDELAYQEQLRLKVATQRDQDDLRERAFQLREETLKKAENELIDLRAQVAAFPAKLEAETKKAAAIEGNSVKREYEHKLQLLQKDFDTAGTVHKNTVDGLHSRLVNNDNIITQLTTQLTAAQNKVSEIAKEALQSASNTKSLADVKDFMQNQNNGQSKSKQ